MPNSLVINLEGLDERTEGRKKHLLSHTVVPSFPNCACLPSLSLRRDGRERIELTYQIHAKNVPEMVTEM